jgi:hypothetical protein
MITDTKLKSAYTASVFCAFCMVFLYYYRLRNEEEKNKTWKKWQKFRRTYFVCACSYLLH